MARKTFLANEMFATIDAKKMNEVFSSFGARDKEILGLYFAFDGKGFSSGCGFTLRGIGTIFNISKERVRQIVAKAERKIFSKRFKGSSCHGA